MVFLCSKKIWYALHGLMGFEPPSEQKLELIVITNLFPVPPKQLHLQTDPRFGLCLPIPRDIRAESGLVRFIPNVIFRYWNWVLFHKTGYKFRRFAGSYSAKVDLMKNMSTIESAGKGHNKLRAKFLWGLVWSPLFPVYCFHPDFWFHGQFWQKWT
jgi:hypothetical protein